MYTTNPILLCWKFDRRNTVYKRLEIIRNIAINFIGMPPDQFPIPKKIESIHEHA